MDVARIRQAGALESASSGWYFTEWRTSPNETIASIRWRVDMNSRTLLLSFRRKGSREGAEWEHIDDSFVLTATSPNLGGTRWWIACHCGRRAAKPYLPPTAPRFRYRHCCRLTYRCQRETRAASQRRRAVKLSRRIGEA